MPTAFVPTRLGQTTPQSTNVSRSTFYNVSAEFFYGGHLVMRNGRWAVQNQEVTVRELDIYRELTFSKLPVTNFKFRKSEE